MPKNSKCGVCGRSAPEVSLVLGQHGACICTECAANIALQFGAVVPANSVQTAENGSRHKNYSFLNHLPTPEEIVARLDEYVIGQTEVKKTLAIAVYNHYLRLADAMKEGNGEPMTADLKDVELDKSNIIMVGPTGSGKTLMAKTIARMLDVPFAIADATTLTEAGYVGEDVENIVRYLYNAAGGDRERTETGIIWVDECFPGDTEVMTEKGFVRFDELKADDRILQWNEDRTMSIVDSERIVKRPYDGKLVSLTRGTRNKHLHLSTPNHNRVVISHGHNHRARNLLRRPVDETLLESYGVPVNGLYDGPGVPLTDAQIQFQVAFAADGNIKHGKYGYIDLKKKRKVQRLLDILSNLPEVKYSHTYSHRTGRHLFYFGDITCLPICKEGRKTLFIDNFIHATLAQKKVFIKELRYWDGYAAYGADHARESVFFCTSKREEADYVQMIAHLCGYFCSIRARPQKSGCSPSYACTSYAIEEVGQGGLRKRNVPYKGDVYCVTVPSHMIMIRQKGQIVITGNCDKIASKTQNVSITRDVSGEGVQQALLKIVEGTICRFPPNGGRKHPDQQLVEIDTSKILFICGGAFVGLKGIVEQRVNASRGGGVMGFGQHGEEDPISTEERVRPEDLIEYGLIPEFVGRLPIIAELDELSEDDLVQVLSKPKNSIVNQYRKMLKFNGIDLQFDDAALREMARMAIARNTGARGLRAEMEQVMRDIMFTAPNNHEKGKQVVVTKEMVDKVA